MPSVLTMSATRYDCTADRSRRCAERPAPSRNNLSHANKRRDAALAERLFWAVFDHLQRLSPGFAAGGRGKGLARRFRRVIHVVDSSTIALIASCIDWAQHRRRKAAAKLHVRLDLHSLLPRFVLVESAKAADSIRAAAIWKVLTKTKEITCSYKTFVAHVRRLQHQAATTETKAITPEKRKGFTWDPTPNREELIGSETANPRNRMPESL